MSLIGRENELEQINRSALKIARDVANSTGTLMAGNICNSTVYDPADPESFERVRKMFDEQIK